MNRLAIACIVSIISVLCLFSCSDEQAKEVKKRFENLSKEQTGIDFSNDLEINDTMNFFNYGYFYMGGGVAIGDFNNDQLSDIYFTGNMVENKLYLNQGNLQFQDITETSDVGADNRWITGCSVVDINADGLDDIYVSVAGKWAKRNNILYINQGLNKEGIPIFEDQAETYGLDDAGYSIQTCFFDYDNDGDLDVFVGNYEPTPFNYLSTDYKHLIDHVTWEQSDHLYRNDGNNTFTDVTEEAGLLSYGLTIGVIAQDFNKDGLTDLYLSNDFHTPDYFYLNNGDGTFKEISKESMQHTAFYGMGIDAADYNNDGLMDFVQLDMAAADNFRSKANMASMDVTRFWRMVDYGFHYQYMYNALQQAQGIRADGIPYYSETAKTYGLDKTDWSWACLFADYDNDGFKDLYITNGTRRDINNKDYFKWLERVDVSLKIKYKELSIKDLTEKMPYEKIDNQMFRNNEGLGFENTNEDWGLELKGFSNGAAYADLDNDGDLELIVNNIDSTASIINNLSIENGGNNYIKVNLVGPEKNPYGLGAKIYLKTTNGEQYQEHTLVRGFQSSIEKTLHFGLGQEKTIESIKVIWPDSKIELIQQVKANQEIAISYKNAKTIRYSEFPKPKWLKESAQSKHWAHKENEYNDFDREVLLPHKMSAFGPALAMADLDQDGKNDLFLGGSKGNSAYLYHSSTGTYESFGDAQFEDVDASFIDLDNDDDLDLYIVSGGNEEANESSYYQDRIYRNDEGTFHLIETDFLPRSSGATVEPMDFDEDGDVDLLITGRQIPGKYPSPASSTLLVNESSKSSIKFTDQTNKLAKDLERIGMVTDAVWEDYDQDGDQDIILVGEWMEITVLENHKNSFKKKSISAFDSKTTGWWNSIEKADFDGDGDMDLIFGNLGNNYKYKANQKQSFDVYASDFDDNGKQDVVLGFYEDGVQFPVRGKQCSSEQIPNLKKKYTSYDKFAKASLDDIYSDVKLKKATHYQAKEFSHMYAENLGNGNFELREMPVETQIGTINTMKSIDLNKDGHLDLLAAGNLFNAEVETPRSDACYGWILLNNGDGSFRFVPQNETGLYIPFETRKIAIDRHSDSPFIYFANNNAPLQIYEFNQEHIN